MSTMNDKLYANVHHPALGDDGVHLPTIEASAATAALNLSENGYAHVVLEPDDGTRYEFMLVRRVGPGAPYLFASSFGAAYPWTGNPTMPPDYATGHYVGNGATWTGVVIALFLNAVAENLSVAADATVTV